MKREPAEWEKIFANYLIRDQYPKLRRNSYNSKDQ